MNKYYINNFIYFKWTNQNINFYDFVCDYKHDYNFI